MNKDHSGSDFNDFLKEEGIFEEVEEIAVKKIFKYKAKVEMEKNNSKKGEY